MSKKNQKKQLITLAVAVLALIAVGAAAYVHDTRPAKSTNSATVNPHTDTAASSKDTGTNHPGQGSASGNTSSNSNSASTPSPTTDPQYNSSTLSAPTQTFNKSHTPVSLSQTDSSQPDYPSLDSTCMTVQGATCEIHATLSGTTKVVAGPSTVSDATTGLDLPWNAKDQGLTKGTWTIVAVAKYNGQTSTSSPTTLVVNP